MTPNIIDDKLKAKNGKVERKVTFEDSSGTTKETIEYSKKGQKITEIEKKK